MDIKFNKHLNYANGYRQLGMFADAHEELSKIPEELQHSKEVLVTDLAISSDAKSWERVAKLSSQLVAEYPEEVEWWIQWAYAVRRTDSLDEAKEILKNALVSFPVEPCLHYNMGCYACVEGEINQAKDWILQAIALEGDYRLMAMEDEDLVEIRDWVQEIAVN